MRRALSFAICLAAGALLACGSSLTGPGDGAPTDGGSSRDGTILVEASPYDRIWGIGLAASDPRALDARQWRGQNLLGRILTSLRDELLAV